MLGPMMQLRLGLNRFGVSALADAQKGVIPRDFWDFKRRFSLRPRRLVLVIAASFALFWPVAAAAEEKILDFDSRIAIQKDGTLDVTEAIRVNAENVSINHGIYRDFPTRYDLPNGGRMRVTFKFLDASLDGAPVESDVSRQANGVRIRLGSADTTVAPGEHTYKIHYKVDRELGFFKEYDELYWNVTGTGWGFPIDRASATITLPSPARFGQRAFYTGPQGSTSSFAEVTGEGPGTISFATTQPLGPYEGLTVAAAFPKGVIAEPTQGQKMARWLADLLPMVAAALGVLAVIGYLIYAWARAGRNPRAGTVVPLFSPPDGMSPAAMRYVTEQGMDNRAFAAALVEAGVKGHVKLVEEKGFLFFGGDKYVEGLSDPGAGSLAGPEASAIRRLVSPGERLELDNKNHSTFSSARQALEDGYKAEYENKAFKRNYNWAGTAILVWLIGAYLTALAIVAAEGTGLERYLLLPPVLGGAAWWIWRVGKNQTAVTGCLVKMVAFLLAFGAVGLGFMAIPLALSSGRWQPILFVMLGLPIAISSFLWISAPTKEGRLLLDKIAGFKQYLSTTERERLDRMQAPADSLQLFERYLPYAIALGVENRWADRFAGQLAAAAAAGQQGFAWYAGSHSPWSDTGGFVDSLGSSLSSSISSASTAPGSSSGSGGGGSSGGGGGGGGGGGW